jgi:hypothetical protein
MAAANQSPVLVNPMVARAAFIEDLEKILKGRKTTWEESGWRMLHDLGLLVPLKAQPSGRDIADDYYLRLEFQYYPDWPPSTRFVNPVTLTFDQAIDLCWLPKIEGTEEIRVHDNDPRVGQLVCCSASLEFYQIGHSVKPEHIWDHAQQNFALTINQVQLELNSDHYKGRFCAKIN